MDDMASVGLNVDSRDVRKASGDLDKFAGAGDRAGGSAGRATGAFAGMGKGLAVAAASALAAVVSIAALSSQLNRFIDATVTNEKAQAQLGAAITSTGGAAGKSVADLNAHAAALQKVTNFGDEAINAMQGLLLTFTQIKGDQFDAATRATLDLATAMGTDLNSAALQVGKALNDPVLGMTALSRSGIQFTEAQKEMVKGMVAANDTIGAQTIILAELERQFSGSAEAARNTLGGALASLRNAFGDLFELSGPGSENLRASIERLTAAVANPAFFAAVQSIGTALFAAAEIGINAMTALAGAFTILTQNLDIVAISLGVLALTQVQAMAAALVTLAVKVAFAATSYTALAIAMKAIPFVAAVAGLTILYRLLATTADFAKDGAAAFNGFNDATASLSGVTEVLEKDYVNLAAAQRSMAEAAKIGSAIERDAAIQAVSGINARITANENLRRDLALTQQSELLALRSAAAAEEERFNKSTALIAARAVLNSEAVSRIGMFGIEIREQFDFIDAEVRLQADGVDAITDAYRTLLEAQVASGVELTREQQRYMDGADAVALLNQQVIDAVAALGLLEVPANLAPNLDNAAGSAGSLERNLIAADSALSALVNSTANLGLEAIGLEAQNRALEAGNSLIDARTQGLIATKREELSSALGSDDAAIRAVATLELNNYTAALGRTGAAQTANDALTKAYNDSIRETSAATAGTGAASGRAAGNIEELAIEMTEAEKAALAYAEAIEGMVVSGIGRAVDWMVDGFKGGFNGLLNIAKDTLKQIIAFYLKNRVMLSLGIGGGGVGGATQALAGAAGGGGPLGIGGGGAGVAGAVGNGGILGGLTGAAGAFGSGLSVVGNGLMAGGLGGAAQAGLGAISGGLSMGGLAGFATAAGAALPFVAAAAAVVSFFKSKTKTIDSGIRATIDMEDAMFESFKEIEKSRFFGLSKKRSTSSSAISGADGAPLDAAVFAIRESVIGATESLGVSSDVFNGFSHKFELSLKGLDEAARASAISEEFTRMGDSLANLVPHITSMNELFAVAANRVALTDRLLQAQGKTEELTARIRAREMDATNELNKALLAQVFAAEDAASAVNAFTNSLNEDMFATGQDFVRATSRTSNNQLFTPQQSDAELRAELRALNISMERLVSTSEITAGNTGRGADAADDTLAFQLEQTL